MIPDPDRLGEADQRYDSAGWVYLLLGVAVMALAVLHPDLVKPERRQDIVHLLVGLPFFVLFAVLIARGDRLITWVLELFRVHPEPARRTGRWLRHKAVLLLTLSALGRTLFFLANAAGHRPRLAFSPPSFHLEATEPEVKMLVSAAFMAVIVIYLARASWLPWLRGEDC